MKFRTKNRKFILAIIISALLPVNVVQASSSTPVKVLASKSLSGNRERVFNSGETAMSEYLWSASFPTKMKLTKDYSGYSGKVLIKFKNLATGEDQYDARINVALWSVGGKKVDDRTLYDWSPVSSSTDFEFPIYGFDGVKKGKYIWVITTSSSKYEGESEIKVPVSIS